MKLLKVKSLGVGSLLALGLTFNSASLALASTKVGLVDIQKVLLSIDEGKSVRGKLEKFYKDKQDLLKKDEDKFKELQTQYEKQRMVMNDKTKADKEQELRELYMSIQNKTMGYQKEIQEMEGNLKTPLIDKIRDVAKDVSKQEGVGMTFDEGASVLIYAEEEKNITEEVTSAYNKKYPSKK